MRNYLGDGNLVTLTTSAAIATGAGLLSGGFFGITCAPAGAGQSVECLRQGEFTVTKNSAEAWAVGDTIYWNDTTKVFTIASSGNTQVGFATEIAANPSSSGVLLLVPKPGGVVSAVTNPVTGGITFSAGSNTDVLGMADAEAGDVITFNGVDWLAQAPQEPIAFTDPYISISSRRTELVENPDTALVNVGTGLNSHSATPAALTSGANVQVLVATSGTNRFNYAADGSTLPTGIRGIEVWDSAGASVCFNTVRDDGSAHGIGTVGTDAWKTGTGFKFVHPIPYGLTAAQIITFIQALRFRSEAASGSMMARLITTPLKWKIHPDSTTEDVLTGAGASQALTHSSAARYPVTDPTDAILCQLLGAGDARWLADGTVPSATYGNVWKSGAMRVIDFAADGIGLTAFRIYLPAGAYFRVRALKQETQ